MPNLINELISRELDDAFEGAEGMVLVSLNGLSVAETEGIRTALADHGVRLRMIRNRLALRSLKAKGYEPADDLFVGNMGACWGEAEDAIHAAKVLHSSPERKAGKVTLRGGIFEGNLLDQDAAVSLASLPSREELRAKVLGTIIAPAQKLVGLLNAPQGALARVLQARVDAGGESST